METLAIVRITRSVSDPSCSLESVLNWISGLKYGLKVVFASISSTSMIGCDLLSVAEAQAMNENANLDYL